MRRPPAPIARFQRRYSRGGQRSERYNPQDLREFRRLIIALRNEMLDDLQEAGNAVVAEGEKRAVEADRTALIEQTAERGIQDHRHSETSQQQHLLAELDAALERMERGEYGRCMKCGGLIDSLRLSAIPHARFCVQCKP